ncbi:MULTISPECIES: pyridoxal phosphate-dependent aminotransferase [unclassified Pseudofrankia]|uniref:pyridoxal phosphate-dependent aminotransferase n=1 Tax=unclassified Pseudofrankia TaxID=2994372 RepID=UPI0009F5F16C|nr:MULTISPECIES: pyridoxal phosphate-dependent aminotransferase [unclassified Pseudofrankia]MDT3443217.1 pyridoxal phosphate-dependent aminotransferase [Pseudofrankia sp. BMG5.37]
MTTFAPSAISALIDSPVRYDLGESTCPPLSLGELVEPAELKDVVLGYGTTRGDDELRGLIAADAGVSADEVLVTVGAIEAMFLLTQATCAPGDRVALVTPCFPPARGVPQGLGARVDLVASSFDDGYRLPLDALTETLTERTRLVSVASPQNPSGVRLTDDEVRALLAAVADRAPGAVVLVDETYRESTYGDAPVPPSAAARSARVVTCSSLSKAHGAPGLRLGWLTTTDADLSERLREAKFVTTIACPTLDELLAVHLLRQRTAILAPHARRLERALAELSAWARDQPVEVVRPDGGAICCLRLPTDRFPDGAVAGFYARLATLETRVAPGSWFGEHDRVFRVGFGHLAAHDFSAALDRLAAALAG